MPIVVSGWPAGQELKGAGASLHGGSLWFLQGCLEWDPERRLTPDQALQHEWITRGASMRSPPGPLSRLSSAQGGGLLYRHASNMSANSAVPVPLLIPVPVSARVSIK